MTVGDITTILGFFSLNSDQRPCESFGEELSVFLVRMTTSAGTLVRVVRQQLPNIKFDPRKKAKAQEVLCAHAKLEVLPNLPYPRVFLIGLHSLKGWTRQY